MEHSEYDADDLRGRLDDIKVEMEYPFAIHSKD